jgi:hypothetical protein
MITVCQIACIAAGNMAVGLYGEEDWWGVAAERYGDSGPRHTSPKSEF